MTNQSIEKLHSLFKEYQAQPVGSGYIDIIVSRTNYHAFAKALIENGFEIIAISWWEYINSTTLPNSYGLGGPQSLFFPGWFAETCADLDELPLSDNSLSTLVSVIENKTLGEFNGQIISFKTTDSLTPAFWLKIDE